MGLGQTCLDLFGPTETHTGTYFGVAIFDRCQNEFQETMRQSGSRWLKMAVMFCSNNVRFQETSQNISHKS